MKEFQTAVKAAEPRDDVQTNQFTIAGDDRVYTAYEPSPAQFAVVLSKVGRHTSLVTKIAGIIDFFVSVMDDEDAAVLSERLLDRNDPFEIEDVEQVLSWLIEEWGGHPTQEPSGSATPQSPTGRTSTTTSGKSTRSRSQSTAS